MIHLQHLLHRHWLVLLSNNQGLDFKCLPIWGVLFEMSELRHRRFLFCIKDGHQQLCWRVKTCKLSCNCLVGHRETEVLAGKALARKGCCSSVTAACFFQFGWKRATTNSNLISNLPENICGNHLASKKSEWRDWWGQTTPLYSPNCYSRVLAGVVRYTGRVLVQKNFPGSIHPALPGHSAWALGLRGLSVRN